MTICIRISTSPSSRDNSCKKSVLQFLLPEVVNVLDILFLFWRGVGRWEQASTWVDTMTDKAAEYAMLKTHLPWMNIYYIRKKIYVLVCAVSKINIGIIVLSRDAHFGKLSETFDSFHCCVGKEWKTLRDSATYHAVNPITVIIVSGFDCGHHDFLTSSHLNSSCRKFFKKYLRK
jgi:hypothetical protein